MTRKFYKVDYIDCRGIKFCRKEFFGANLQDLAERARRNAPAGAVKFRAWVDGKTAYGAIFIREVAA